MYLLLLLKFVLDVRCPSTEANTDIQEVGYEQIVLLFRCHT